MTPDSSRRPLSAEHDGRRFSIVPDAPDVGIYLYVYESETCVRDEPQDDAATCIRVAREKYGVPTGTWKEAPTEGARPFVAQDPE